MTSLSPGTRLGHFEIIEAVGAGGMGEVLACGLGVGPAILPVRAGRIARPTLIKRMELSE